MLLIIILSECRWCGSSNTLMKVGVVIVGMVVDGDVL
jgi:hypothetical protein